VLRRGYTSSPFFGSDRFYSGDEVGLVCTVGNDRNMEVSVGGGRIDDGALEGMGCILRGSEE